MAWWEERGRWLRDHPGRELPPELETFAFGQPASWHAELAATIAERSRPAPPGCVLWSGAKSAKGYGRIKYRGRLYSPHRVALEASIGRLLGRHEDACHRCDTPSCVKPEHLFAGTRSANMKDARDKGRLVTPDGYAPGEHGFERGAS